VLLPSAVEELPMAETRKLAAVLAADAEKCRRHRGVQSNLTGALIRSAPIVWRGPLRLAAEHPAAWRRIARNAFGDASAPIRSRINLKSGVWNRS
jgi:hypothetical protein